MQTKQLSFKQFYFTRCDIKLWRPFYFSRLVTKLVLNEPGLSSSNSIACLNCERNDEVDADEVVVMQAVFNLRGVIYKILPPFTSLQD